MLYVFGHLNPDSDTICSALVASEWLKSRGDDAQAFRLGELNPESRFILEQAGYAAPQLLTEDVTGKDVWLVDFSDLEQGPAQLNAANIRGIVDHHRLGTVMTESPLEMWVKPVGCCCTLLWWMTKHDTPMAITRGQAILMLGAILSDTVCLTSATTTPMDIDAVDALFAIANIDADAFKRDLLAAKTDLSGYTPEQALNKDAKNYQINGNTVKVAQLEISSQTPPTELLNGILALMRAPEQDPALTCTVLMVTEIDTAVSQMYFSAPVSEQNQPVRLENTLSRKKQGLPWLMQNRLWENA